MSDAVDEILGKVLNSPHETEVVEFKDRKTLSKDEMGRYFSALSNEANLRGIECAWMIFGMTDDGRVVNSDFLDTVESQNKLKKYISEQTTGRMSYIGIHARTIDGKRILLFQIPAARDGTPTSFKTFAYERQGDSVFGLSDEKRMRIMRSSIPDWSASILEGATVDDLDPDAIALARHHYKRNHPLKSEECDSWDDATFLNKMGFIRNGRVTYAAVVLFGNPELEYSIPDVALNLRWILRDNDRNTVDGEIYTVPLIIAIDEICSKIRNVKYNFYPGDANIPDRIHTYDPEMLREMLNNCVAHQDYRMREIATVVEYERDRLVFRNAGSFIPGSIENVISSNSPASYYRNKVLAEGMAKIGLVDMIGSGIVNVFRSQMERYFPLPEYDLSNDHVEAVITGRIIDEAFAETLAKNPKIGFEDVILLDKVQKKKPISIEEADRLRSKGFIEGRRPNYIISRELVLDIDDDELKASVLKQRGFANKYYKDLIIQYLAEYGEASKQELVGLLKDKLPESLDENQKYTKITNLLRVMRDSGIVENIGSSRITKYRLARK